MSSSYPRPMLTADVVVLAAEAGARRVLLIQRGNPPFEGCWALPGGFVEEREQVAVAAPREFDVEELPELAFDHALIVSDALALADGR